MRRPITLTHDERALVLGALNEVLSGIDPSELPSGRRYDERQVSALCQSLKLGAVGEQVTVQFDETDAGLLVDALRDVVSAIEDWEFQTRMGFDKEEAIILQRRMSAT